MNQIQGRFAIANEDFVYVLSTFVVERFRWNERFGWRRALEVERLAQLHFWREVGRMMNIVGIPETYEEMERFNASFERDRFAYTEAGHRIAVAMIEMFVGKIPGLSKRLGTRGVCALLGEPLLAAPDLPGPTAAERRTAEGALKLRAGGRRRQTRLPCVRAGG